jgi:predicted HTH domain antitoxin
MCLTIHIPEEAERHLREAFGDALDREVLEAMAVEAYRRGRVSFGHFAHILSVDARTANELLMARGVLLDVALERIEQEVAMINDLLRMH